MRGTEEMGTPEDASKHYVQFYKKAKQDKAETLKEGRPICKMVDYVKIHIPGDKTTVIDRPVSDVDRRQYGNQYRAFLEDKSQDEASGTLLTAWGGLTPERCAEYAIGKIRTVEQLAGASDAALQNMGPGSTAQRQRARDYVELMKGAAPVAQMRAEMEEKDAQIKAMQNALKEQGEAIEALKKSNTKRQ